jgi:site-specific DNA-methyltransferase (adenine-specific)
MLHGPEELLRRPATVVLGEAIEVLRALPDGCAGLVYADPPFNTGRRRVAYRTSVVRDDSAQRTGFAGRRYRSHTTRGDSFDDGFDDYLAWLKPRLVESRRILAAHGSLYLHVDPRESHYCKVLLDQIFGRRCFLNEIVWAYDFGARASRRWAAKHDVILLYARDASRYHFDAAEVDRIPYLAPGLQTPDRQARGKLPTDVWWQTIVPTRSAERTGYPTQKPSQLLRRIITASSRRGDLVVDWCAGSGTTGAAAAALGRRFLLIDRSAEAVAVMRRRLAAVAGMEVLDRNGGAAAPAAVSPARDTARAVPSR